MSGRYNKSPSSYFDNINDYEAFCFDEASCFVIDRLNAGQQISKKDESKNIKHYTSFSEMYKNILKQEEGE